jgi:hypothetical protein
MPRLRSVISGVTVEVSDETAEVLGSEWEPEEAEKPTPAPLKK